MRQEMGEKTYGKKDIIKAINERRKKADRRGRGKSDKEEIICL